MTVPINPKLPDDFYITPNEDRTAEELDCWWDRPYITGKDGGYRVECLDGGAWDRPTLWGVFDTLESAIACAETGPVWMR